LKFFRNLIGIQDEYYMRQMIQDRLFEPIISIVIETMPRDNLLNSACLEFFEFIKNHGIKVLMSHLVENYREKFESITYVETFRTFVQRYDGSHGFTSSVETSFLETEEESPRRHETGRGRWSAAIKDLDETEEEYFNTSDDEEEKAQPSDPSPTGASPSSKPLVDYNSDEENENSEDPSAGIDTERTSRSPSPKSPASKDSSGDDIIMTPTSSTPGRLERSSEKRRREEDEEDEIGKLSQHKRRSSSGSVGSNSSALRRKKAFSNVREGNNGPKKIAISLSPAIKTGGDSPGGNSAN
jgi:protein phosphatase-4 regulatory subunit 3